MIIGGRSSPDDNLHIEITDSGSIRMSDGVCPDCGGKWYAFFCSLIHSVGRCVKCRSEFILQKLHESEDENRFLLKRRPTTHHIPELAKVPEEHVKHENAIVKINENLDIVEIEFSGDISFEECMHSLELLKSHRKESKIRKAIINTVKLESMPETSLLFTFAAALPNDMRIALIFSPDQPTMQDIRFIDNVAFNRKIDIRRFETRDDAIRWILSSGWR